MVNLMMLVGLELSFGQALVAKSEKDYFNVSLDLKATGAVIVLGGVVTFQFNA